MELQNFFAQNNRGDIQPGATAYVYESGTSALASVYNESGGAISNPFNAGKNGLIQFRVANGEYDVRVISDDGEYTLTIQANDVSDSIAAAAAEADRAEAAFDSFDDRYLGEKSAPPAADNDGDPLITGALYWDTTSPGLYVWDGSAWQANDVVALSQDASNVHVNTSTGSDQPLGEALDRRVIYVDTIADLQALPTGEMVDGQQVRVLSYHPPVFPSERFYGGGVFSFSSGSAPSDPLSGVYVNAASGGHFQRNREGDVLNVEWFGAVPDGSTDCSPAIQAAVDLEDSKGISFPSEGTYVVDMPIKIEKADGFRIEGFNKKRTTISKKTTTALGIQRTYGGETYTYDTPCIFALVAPNDSYCRHVQVSDINTRGDEDSYSIVHFLAPRISYCHFDNMDASWGASFYKSEFTSFIVSFNKIRSNIMSIGHWNILSGNAYTFYQTYANGNTPSSGSSAGYIINANASFYGCDTDSVNFGWKVEGGDVNLIGCFTESRKYQVLARNGAAVTIDGGRFFQTVIGSQANDYAYILRADDSASIVASGMATNLGDFTEGAGYTNKYLISATGNGIVKMLDYVAKGDNMPNGTHLVSNSGVCVLQQRGGVERRYSGGQLFEDGFRPTSTKEHITGSAPAGVITLLSIPGLSYNRCLSLEAKIRLRSTGNKGADSFVEVGQLLAVAYSRGTQDVDFTYTGAFSDGGTGTSTITVDFSADDANTIVVTLTTGSTAGTVYYDIEYEWGVTGHGKLIAS